LGFFGPKGAETGTYTTTFVYQGPFKKNSFTGFEVINEVVLEIVLIDTDLLPNAL
jgi:hypothetical protein